MQTYFLLLGNIVRLRFFYLVFLSQIFAEKKTVKKRFYEKG